MRRSTVLSSIARPSIYTVGTRNSISSFASPTHQSNCLHRPSDDQSTGIEKFTKWAKKLHTISADNPLTNKYFRSESAVNHELERHSELGYWYIVHPLSKLSVYFDMWQLLLNLVLLVVKPISAASSTSMQINMPYFPEISVVLDVAAWLTIITKFFHGYIIEQTKTMVLEPKRIAWNYVGSIFFICDVLSSIPVLPTLYLCEAIWGTRFLVGVGFLFIFCQLRLIRIASVVRIINQLAVYFQVTSKGRVFLLICMTVFLLTVHNFALLQLLIPKLVRKYFSKLKNEHRIWYVKYNLHEKPFAHIYTHCVLKSTAFMLAIRVDFYRMENQEEDYLLAIATYVVGKVIVCATYVIVAVSLLSNKSIEVKFFSIINQLDEYMRQKQLPLNLRDRIKKYYNFKFQERYFKSEMIHDMLPSRLKRDINLHQCKSLIQNVSLFSHLTAEEVSNVIEALKPEIFLPKDTVMLAGTYGDRMFFISSGTVAVYTHSGREIYHLEDGAYFGEVALVLKTPYRVATVIAVETTHVYILKRNDFNSIMLKNRKVMKKVLKRAYARVAEIRKYEEEYKKKLFEQMHGAE